MTGSTFGPATHSNQPKKDHQQHSRGRNTPGKEGKRVHRPMGGEHEGTKSGNVSLLASKSPPHYQTPGFLLSPFSVLGFCDLLSHKQTLLDNNSCAWVIPPDKVNLTRTAARPTVHPYDTSLENVCRLRSQMASVQTQVLSFISSVTLGNLPNISRSYFLICKMGIIMVWPHVVLMMTEWIKTC